VQDRPANKPPSSGIPAALRDAREAPARARDAANRGAWSEAYRRFQSERVDRLSPADLESFADAAWWVSRVEESLAVRRQAHAAWAAAGHRRRAAFNAWMLAVEYGYLGKPALAAGWATKASRHLASESECAEHGFLAFVEAETAYAEGDMESALAHARRMVGIGTRCESRDVVALGRQLEARLSVARHRTKEGLALLDEVMGDVLAGELSDLVTGWLYCLAVTLCLEVSDLPRAKAWDETAMAWCATLPSGTPFHGLCRVHHVELLSLGGAWDEADAEAERACRELVRYHPSMAGEAFYVAGELRRRMQRSAAAEAAFRRAHECGRDPQPGLALLRFDQGKPEEAAAALRTCLAGGDSAPSNRARLLAACVDAELALNAVGEARAAAQELARAADGSGQALVEALAVTAAGAVALAEGDVPAALERLRRGRSLWLALGLPYEAAEARLRLASACRAAGDHATADLERAAARSVLGRQHVIEAGALARDGGARPVAGILTPRQVEVLRLVAAGKTNREIAADLLISAHTVSRHLDNIYGKLGVSSRAAAASFAHTHGLV
jgi:DNA-binding CsgD family transcriptional regulator/tetratricopeptide (TPR) repeat protein